MSVLPIVQISANVWVSDCLDVRSSRRPNVRLPDLYFFQMSDSSFWPHDWMPECPNFQLSGCPSLLLIVRMSDCLTVQMTICPKRVFLLLTLGRLWLFLLTLSTFCRFDVFSVFKFRHSSIFNSLRLGRFQHSCILSCWSFQFPMLSTFWVSAVFNNLGLWSFHDFELSWCSALTCIEPFKCYVFWASLFQLSELLVVHILGCWSVKHFEFWVCSLLRFSTVWVSGVFWNVQHFVF